MAIVCDSSASHLNVHGFSVPMLTYADGYWFRGRTLTNMLGYVKSAQALQRVPKQHRASLSDLVHNKGAPLENVNANDFNNGKSTYIDEAGLYILTMNSKKPKAHDFCVWIAEILLPQARQSGSADTFKMVQDILEEDHSSSHGMVYAVTSPLLNAVKIGCWSGSMHRLFSRYHTYFGKDIQLISCPVKDCRQAEKEMKDVFRHELLCNELYNKALWLTINVYLEQLRV